MASVDEILAGLAAERADHAAAGRLAEVQRIGQEMIAHRTLARLRQRRAGYAERGDTVAVAQVDGQIAHWRAMVTVDVDETMPVAAAADTVRKTVRPRRPRRER